MLIPDHFCVIYCLIHLWKDCDIFYGMVYQSSCSGFNSTLYMFHIVVLVGEASNCSSLLCMSNVRRSFSATEKGARIKFDDLFVLVFLYPRRGV